MTDNRSKMALACKLKEDMVNHVAHSEAIFRNEQIDEPDLEISEKKNIAFRILEASPGQFLHRFGKFLKKHHLDYFDTLETCAGSYELDFYLQEAKKNVAEATELSRKKHVKNRRYAALKKLINEGSPYFSETEMRRRDPLMYEHLVGRHLTEEERDEVNRLDMSSMTLLGLLLDHMDRDAARALQAQQEELEDAAREESDSDSEEDEDEEKPEVPEEERDLLRREFISHMYRNFIEGKDKDFDYGAVDENTEYDNLEVVQQDAEDKYFDAESPSEEPQPQPKEESEEVNTGEQKPSHPYFDSDKSIEKPHGKRHYAFESEKHKLNDPFFDSDRPNAPSPTGKRHYDFESEKHKLNDPFFDSDRPNIPSPKGKHHYAFESEKHELGHPFFDSDKSIEKPHGKKHFESQKQDIDDPFFDSEKNNSSAPSSCRQRDLEKQELESEKCKEDKPHGKRHYDFESKKHELGDAFFDSDRPNTQSPTGKHHFECETEKHELGHAYFDSDKSNIQPHEKRHFGVESKEQELSGPVFDSEKVNDKPHGKRHYDFESKKHELGDAFFDSDRPNTQSPTGKHHFECETEKHELGHAYFDSDKSNGQSHEKQHFGVESKEQELGGPVFDSEKTSDKPHGKRHYDFESQKHNLGDPFFDADKPATVSATGTRHYEFESEKHNLEHAYFDSDKPAEKENDANVTQKSSSSEDELDAYMKTLMNQEVRPAGRKQFPGKANECSFSYSSPMKSDDYVRTSSMEVECSSISNQSVDDEPCLPNVRRSHPHVTSPKNTESRPVDENDEAYLTNIPRPTSPVKKSVESTNQ